MLFGFLRHNKPENEKKRPKRRRKISRFAILVVLIVSLITGVFATNSAKALVDPVELAFVLACSAIGGFIGTGCPVFDAARFAIDEAIVAQNKLDFIGTIAKYSSIIDGWLKLDKLYNKFADLMKAAGASRSAIESAADQAVIKTIVKTGQGIADGAAKDTQLKVQAEVAVQTAFTDAEIRYICDKVETCKMPMHMETYSRLVSRMVSDGIHMRYRGETDDGDGPQYVKTTKEIRCGEKSGTENIKFGSNVGGDSSSCRGKKLTEYFTMQDADLTVSSVGRDKVLEVPSFKKGTYTDSSGTQNVNVPEPKAGKSKQSMWMAALNYCYQLAGPRPTPPYGDAAETPEGKVKRAQWNHCAAQQEAFIKQCADRIGRLSRPDCSNDDMKDLCTAIEKGCKAANEANVVSKEFLDGCSNGLSLYQTEHLCNAMCGSKKQNEVAAQAGAPHYKLLADLALCSIVRNSWERKMEEQDKAFLKAVDGMESLDECWAAAR